jgi:hypothetical protein
MEILKVTPDEILGKAGKIEEKLYEMMTQLGVTAEIKMRCVYNGDSTVTIENCFKEWAKEWIQWLSKIVSDE